MILWLKTAHLVALVVWMTGMIAAPALAGRLDGENRAALFVWFRRTVTPAMLLALALGVAMAQLADWWSAAWLQAKLVFVFAMVALHGVVSGRLRRLSDTGGGGAGGADAANGGVPSAPPWFAGLGWAAVALFALIATLAVRKTVF